MPRTKKAKAAQKYVSRVKKQSLTNLPHFSLVLAFILVALVALVGTLYLIFFARAATVYVVPSSIASDCSVDVTTSLNSWIATVPSDATMQFGLNGCYRVDQTMNITAKSNLIVDGNGATIRRITPTPASLVYPKSNNHIYVSSCTGITIKNLHVLGLNTVSSIDPNAARTKAYVFESDKFGAGYGNKAFEAGIKLYTDTGVTIDNVTTDGTYGDGLLVGAENSAGGVRDITIKNSSIDRNGRQGIALVTVANAIIDNVRILHSYNVGIDLEPNGATASVNNVEIKNSYLNSYTIAFSPGGTYDVSNLYIHDNTIRAQDTNYAWIHGVGGKSTSPRRQNWRIANNTVGVRTLGVYLYNIDGATVKNNLSPIFGNYPGITLVNTTNLTSTNNTFTTASALVQADATSSITQNCDNRITDTGLFNLPESCSQTLPNNPPSVSLAAAPISVTQGQVVTLNATAIDTDSYPVQRVDFYDGTTLLNSDTTAPYVYAWRTTSSTTIGTHHLTARATDTGNLSTLSTVIDVIVTDPGDIIIPTTTITSPLNNTTVGGTIAVAAGASDNVGVTKVELYIDLVLGATDSSAPYNFSWNTNLVTNGTHVLIAKAYDAAGNVGFSTATTVIVNNPIVLKPGDVNGDQHVTLIDLSILLSHYGKSGAIRSEGDVNGNGVVNLLDMSIVLTNYGT